MRLLIFSLYLISVLCLTNCEKITTTTDCLNQTQKETFLHSLENLALDTTQLPASERALMNEIRVIANDVTSLSNGLDINANSQDYYNAVRANFSQHINTVIQKATVFYNGDLSKIILAKNAFVLMSYDALQRAYPEFMWVQLGVFVAEDVRSGLVLALSMRQNFLADNFHVPVNGTDINIVLLETCNELINGQLNVLTDIGPFAIMNRNLGAAKMMNQSWLSPEAKQGFMLQKQAEDALNNHDCTTFSNIQTDAAIQFGAHEQIYILQPMWNAPFMQQFADLNEFLLRITGKQFVFFGDIFIGTNKNKEAQNGYIIKLPASITDLSNAQQRIEIARNGFNTLNRLRQDVEWNNWIAYSQIKIGYCSDVYQLNN